MARPWELLVQNPLEYKSNSIEIEKVKEFSF
jgi:hypothetical protein